ncbi:MAG: recombination regulator RecX [Oscillospiraceae bacterium]|nr:recombination regulator RecX [Oscillospiraceae bacterium]
MSDIAQDALKKHALEILGHRAMSRRELVDKLVVKGGSPETVELVADWLVEMRFLNDADYAEQIVRHYAGKGYGKKRIEQELWRRGVSKELWDTALEALPEGTEKLDRFLAQKLRGELPDRKEEKRAADALLRRGYNWEQISAGLERYKELLEED